MAWWYGDRGPFSGDPAADEYWRTAPLQRGSLRDQIHGKQDGTPDRGRGKDPLDRLCVDDSDPDTVAALLRNGLV